MNILDTYRKKVEEVGKARVNGILLALFGPIMMFPITGSHSAHGMLWAIFTDLLFIISVLFGALLLCAFCFDLVFIQMLNLFRRRPSFMPNKAIRDFEIVSVVMLVSLYGVAFYFILLSSK
jgi:hypothetical protein